MKYLIVVIILVGLAVALNRTYRGGSALTRTATVKATGVAGSVGQGGRRTGQGASRAFKGVNFGGRR